VPSLIPVHRCNVFVDLWPSHTRNGVGSSCIYVKSDARSNENADLAAATKMLQPTFWARQGPWSRTPGCETDLARGRP
jgi:hypothetical protein